MSSYRHWLADEDTPMHEFPIPMNAKNYYKRNLETATPFTEVELKRHKNVLDLGTNRRLEN